MKKTSSRSQGRLELPPRYGAPRAHDETFPETHGRIQGRMALGLPQGARRSPVSARRRRMLSTRSWGKCSSRNRD
ncbi:hypothetical protein SLE2022_127430 [Rubroshorea leprosula]